MSCKECKKNDDIKSCSTCEYVLCSNCNVNMKDFNKRISVYDFGIMCYPCIKKNIEIKLLKDLFKEYDSKHGALTNDIPVNIIEEMLDSIGFERSDNIFDTINNFNQFYL